MKDAQGHGSNARGFSMLDVNGKGIMPSRPFREGTAHQVALAEDHGKIDNGIHSQTINDLPQMQRRHYENIAAELKAQGASAKSSVDHGSRVRQYADRLATTNPLFNRQRFISAATP
jgi:hypothetical protein